MIYDATIKTPCSIVLAGPPLSGKSSLAFNLIKEQSNLFNNTFDNIVWFYGEISKTVKEIAEHYPNIITVHGLPDNLDDYIIEGVSNLHIYDDLQSEISNNKEISNLVSVKCQHKNVSYIIILQNLFHAGSQRVNILKSVHYIANFKSPLQKSSVYHLASKIMPNNQRTFLEIFERATLKPNSYLFIDGHQSTCEEVRLKSDIIGRKQIVYIPTKK